MPPPLDALARIARLPDAAIRERVQVRELGATRQFVLYDLLRHEQALAAGAPGAGRSEIARILDIVQMAYGGLVGLLVGRGDDVLESARDGEWSLRDLLRHGIAVELRYAAQVLWAATRRDDDPLPIPDDRLPCDRLSPPDTEFGDSRTAGMGRTLALLGTARGQTDLLLDPLPDAVLDRPSLWTQFQMTVRMRLHQSAAHLAEIAVQAEKMLHGTPEGEARRILRRCCVMRGLHERWSEAERRAELDARYQALANV
jgi:hypothetical protein